MKTTTNQPPKTTVTQQRPPSVCATKPDPFATQERKDLQSNRRRFIGSLSALGLGSTLLPGTLTAVAQDAEKITEEMLVSAETLAGLSFTSEERKDILKRLNGASSQLRTFEKLRQRKIPNSVPPALVFNPILPGMHFETEKKPFKYSQESVTRPSDLEAAAFWPVTKLAKLIESKQVTSVELTRMYLGRLRRFNSRLNCVVNYTEDLGLAQAERADREIATGNYKGPLHGIPWGAKDLLATKDYKTSWGAEPYKDQELDTNASVVERLQQAGAVLIAKLTLGALAQGDQWYGGRTNNPWDLTRGSSGSSAGPGSATAAGCVGFSIGTETQGSILSPSTECGVTGLRPTFGRVSKYGAMALSWSMDKIGPMCRSVEDCAIVFNSIYGSDGKDNSVIDLPFNWDPDIDIKTLRIGYLKKAFEREISDATDSNQQARVQRNRDSQRLANDVLREIRSLGINLVPIEIDIDTSDIGFILSTESAAAFDELTLSNRDDLMKNSSWPNTFRRQRFVPAVEYIQANRARTLAMRQMHDAIKSVDVYIEPTHSNTRLTNLTGHPAVVLPIGFIGGRPASITFMGQLFKEAETLAVAKAYQDATANHLKHPPGF